MVSVIMLTCNRENFIKNMIEDILRQTFAEFEYIIVDNGSCDNSGRIADSYAERDQRIRVVHLDRAYSIGYGRNCGLREARGEYVTFVDDDDRVKENYLEVLVSLLETNEADIAVCGISEQRGKEIVPQCVYDERIVLSGEEAVVELLKRERIRAGLPTKLIKRKLFDQLSFDENCRSEDARISYKIFAEADQVVLYGIPLYLAVKHDMNNSAFTNDFRKLTHSLLSEYLETYRERHQYLMKKFPDNREFWDYTVWSFWISMCEKVKKFHLTECRELHEKMREQLAKEQKKISGNPYINRAEYEKLLAIVGD